MVSIAIEPEDWYNVLEVKVPYALLGDPYIVQTEGEVVDIGGTYQSGSITKQSDYAVIRIPVDDSVSKIDIIGTSVIPEFGSIAVVIMAAGIVGVMAISRHREGRRKG
jgi:predicted secreted protein with PEFG-CTERM motif